MDAWIKSPVDVLITDEISHRHPKIVSFDGDWYDTIVPRWYFQGRVHYCNIMMLHTVPGVSKK